MHAPDAVRNSPLAWQQGPLAAGGWMEVDKHTLRHIRFPNVYAIGDVAGVPKGKAAAAAKWQVPVAVDQLVSSIQNRISALSYNGYTSCPLITRVGRAILVEFDYNDRPCPTFPPGILSPVEESWAAWVVASVGLKPTYFAMLHGRV
jgi:sulfide:quinone oxidoreductase